MLRHPDGDVLLNHTHFAESRPVQPDQSSNSVTLTWDELTQSGALSHDSGTITLVLQVAGGDETIEHNLTVTVE